LYLPKHAYTKYKMKGGRERTGLGIIKEKPAPNSKFAIMHLIKKEARARSEEEFTFETPQPQHKLQT